jgi:hypothetical protein
MKFLILFQWALLLGGGALIKWTNGLVPAQAFAAGGFVATLSLLSVFAQTKLLLSKKSVALARGLVVLKYPIIGMILYLSVLWFSASLQWLGAGVATSVISGLVSGLYFQRQSNKS